MAADLAARPEDSGILVASCGDAHVANFGFYGSPQRTLAFDLNDFDEAAWAPWEWDVKRLVTSIVIGGRPSRAPDVVVEMRPSPRCARMPGRSWRALAAQPTARYFSHFDLQSNLDSLDRAVAPGAARGDP